jgi:hypothetical protein
MRKAKKIFSLDKYSESIFESGAFKIGEHYIVTFCKKIYRLQKFIGRFVFHLLTNERTLVPLCSKSDK